MIPASVNEANALDSAVQACAKGEYQRDLLAGCHTWSGSSLRGKARNWSGRYKDSRVVLLQRIERVARGFAAAVGWAAGTAHEGPRYLVLTLPSGETLTYGARR